MSPDTEPQINPLADPELNIPQGAFNASWESLRSFRCPEWFRDAKFAIWSHWGPQSVPMFGDWYARQMYIEGHDQYRYHWRKYGHPSQVGYKDIIPLWKAERFDPQGLMRLFVEAGSHYFVAQAMHHDNFDNFDSTHQRWNALRMGPRKDIVKLWQQAAQAYGLPFGVTEHLSASFNWFESNKGCDKHGPYAGVPYDGNDSAFQDLYYQNQGYPIADSEGRWRWYTSHRGFHKHWFQRIRDLIDKYQPDLLYSDGGVPFETLSPSDAARDALDGYDSTEIGRRIVAHLYNTSIAKYGENRAVYNQKNTKVDVYTIGVLDIERGQCSEIAEQPWQTDTSVGDWFYNVKDVYKTAQQVLETLVDIVSKNGNLLLNVPQRPDGTLDDECTYLLHGMAGWMKTESAGIFGTRPWQVAGEGPSTAPEGAFKETAVEWTAEDYRFTSKGDTVYAYQMRLPENGQATIHALAVNQVRPVGSVRLLGQGPVAFSQQPDGLHITLPAMDNLAQTHGFAIEWR
jgi:alpha-L-fucosidase